MEDALAVEPVVVVDLLEVVVELVVVVEVIQQLEASAHLGEVMAASNCHRK